MESHFSAPTRFLVAGTQVVQIFKMPDGYWRDVWGTIFALRDDASSVDSVDRCGVGAFSLPSDVPVDCAPHDYAYSSPAYQAFHTRKEADEYLRSLVRQAPGVWSLLSAPFYFISRIFGGKFWENEATND